MKKRTLAKGERGFAVALGIFSLICFAASLKLFLSAPKLSGEGTVPVLCSLVMLLMTGVILMELKGRPKAFEKGAPFEKKIQETFTFVFPGKVGPMVVYCVLYAVMLGLVGFEVATFVFLALSMITLNSQNKLRMLVISGIAVICILVVFQYIFQVQLP